MCTAFAFVNHLVLHHLASGAEQTASDVVCRSANLNPGTINILKTCVDNFASVTCYSSDSLRIHPMLQHIKLLTSFYEEKS